MFEPLRILLAFLRRDASIHISYRIGFIIDLSGIFFASASLYFLAKMIGPAAAPYLKSYGGDFFAFTIIGVAVAAYQSVGLNAFSQSLRQEQFLNTLEPLLMTPVGTAQLLLGSSLWDFLYASGRVLIYLAVGACFFGLHLGTARIGPTLAVLFVTLAAFMGLGVLAASFIMRFKRGNPVTWLIESTSTLLGGVSFPVSLLPGPLKKAATFLPITHALDALRRTLLTGAGWKDVTPQLMSLSLFTAVLWPIGVFFFGLSLRRSRADGSLGHY